jgi:hypothetical protein
MLFVVIMVAIGIVVLLAAAFADDSHGYDVDLSEEALLMMAIIDDELDDD